MRYKYILWIINIVGCVILMSEKNQKVVRTQTAADNELGAQR